MENNALDLLVNDIRRRLAEIQQEIADAARRAGRDPQSVRLVAVTKTFPAAVLAAVRQAGLREIGENYLQEAEEKFSELGWPEATDPHPPVIRHAIGHIQSNKVRTALRWFEVIETVDSLALAERIDRVAGEIGRIVPVLLQVNISNDIAKYGIFSAEVEGVLRSLAKLAHIRVKGLMTIGRFEPEAEAARPDFAALRTLRDRLRAVVPDGSCLDELSMGMSHDFAVAIEEGATIVRIGSRLLGPRT